MRRVTHPHEFELYYDVWPRDGSWPAPPAWFPHRCSVGIPAGQWQRHRRRRGLTHPGRDLPRVTG